MQSLVREASTIQAKLTELVDDDTRAFNQVMAAFRMPKDNPNRGKSIQKAMIHAAEVPLEVASYASKILDLAATAAEHGNKNAITDIGVAALFADSAVRGAIYNVRINLGSIKDEDIKSSMSKKVDDIMLSLSDKKDKVLEFVEKEL